VEGRHFQLVLKLHPPGAPLPDAIRQIDGLREWTTFEIVADVDPGATLTPQLCHAYLFLECEPGKLDRVTAALDGLAQVEACSQVRAGCDLVAIVRGETFQAIDRFVQDKIQHLDGILRLKKNRVIDLKQL
jgi:DNA-binding Lrp family transcriptional regulator